MARITRDEIARDLRALGLKNGDTVLVHAAVSAIGEVEGGPEAVIDALLAVIGPQGTLLMPTLPSVSETFDALKSPSTVGLLTETFRRRKGVTRSLSPTHPVAGIGPRAAELFEGHILAPTPCGKGTPYGRLAEGEGHILLLGCDQDRNTTLHTVEDHAEAPYLGTLESRYIDPADGKEKAKLAGRIAGPHRNFIGLDPLFRRAGILRIGKVGKAVSRLMKAREMVSAALAEMRRNPALMLCDNPSCRDCLVQKGRIKAARLAREDFTLSVSTSLLGEGPRGIAEAIEEEGIAFVELDAVEGADLPDLSEAARRELREALAGAKAKVSAVREARGRHPVSRWLDLAVEFGAPAVVFPLGGSWREGVEAAARRGIALHIENGVHKAEDCLQALSARDPRAVALAFHPGGFARAGENPFLKTYYHTKVKRHLAHLRISDGTFGGEPTWPGMGNGEVKEMISILRCKSFSGFFTLSGGPASGRAAFREACRAFWKMMDEM